MRCRTIVALVLSLAAIAFSADSASAGTYVVNVCRHADGTPAPTDGWRLVIADDFGSSDVTVDDCAQGGSIHLAMNSGAGVFHGQAALLPNHLAQIGFATSFPPDGTTWAAAASNRAYVANTTGPPTLVTFGVFLGVAADMCENDANGCSSLGSIAAAPLSPGNDVTETIAPADASFPLFLRIGCASAAMPPENTCPIVTGPALVEARIWRIATTLNDPSSPAFAAQPSLPTGTLGGTKIAVTVSATDTGSGVATAQLLVDGQPAGAAAVIDTAGGHCVARSDGSYDFLVPCKTALTQAPVALDISQAPNGSHQLAVRITDAAGNAAVSTPVTAVIDNTPRNVSAPTIASVGTAVGTALAADPGAWTPDGVTFTYAWLRCDVAGANCASIAGATAATYTTTSADGGARILARVSGHLGTLATAADSAATAVISGPGGVLPVPLNPLLGHGHAHNGSGAAPTAVLTAGFGSATRLRRTALVSRRHTAVLRGRLVGADKQPISGAALVVFGHSKRAPDEQVALVNTTATGAYHATIAWGPTRTLRVAWFAFGDDTTPLLSGPVGLHGRAAITLHVSPHAPRNHTGVRYSGSVIGAPGQTAVTIQVRTNQGWLTFYTLRVGKKSRYAAKRVLTNRAGTKYCFRARVLTQSAFPYTAGVSPVTCVRVRA